MLGKWSIKQALRAPVRSISMLLVSALVCTFLAVGINLRYSARMGLDKIRESFLMAAFPNFNVMVDQYGRTESQMMADAEENYARAQAAGWNDVTLERYIEPMVGAIPFAVWDHDWSELMAAPGVEKVARWTQYGVCLKDMGWTGGSFLGENTLILKYMGDEPFFLCSFSEIDMGDHMAITNGETELEPGQLQLIQWDDVGTNYKEAEIPVWTEGMTLDVTSLSWHGYAMGKRAERMRAWEDYTFDDEGNLTGLWLQPGQEYIAFGSFEIEGGLSGTIAACTIGDGTSHTLTKMNWLYDSEGLDPSSQSGSSADDSGFYAGLLPYTSDFWDTEAGEQFTDLQRSSDISYRSVTAGVVDDLSLVPGFYQGKVYIAQGRAFSQEDYDTGAKVCLISGYYADQNKLAVGDRLNMSFYETDFPVTENTRYSNEHIDCLWKPSTLSDGTETYRIGDPFFDEGSYEIVGIYDGYVYDPTNNDVEYSLNKGMSFDTILVPSASLANQPETTRDDAWHTAILVDSKRVNEFLDYVQTSTLLDETDDGVKMDLTVYDQGLSNMTRVLEQLTRVSRLTMGLALGSAGLAVVMLSVLTLQKNKRQIASLRSLGVREKQIPQAVLAGVLAVCLVGAILGAAAGGIVSQKVGSAVLASAKEDVGDGTFSAMLAQSGGDAVDLSIVTSPLSMVLAAAGVMLVLALLCFVLVRREAKNSPILQLGAKE